jgi:YVTN family beta-propeller protein
VAAERREHGAGGAPAVDLGIDGFEDAVEVGRGGFAVVYRARQPALNRTVAVKVLAARLDDIARERFAREGWAMGTLAGHPNIVHVIGTGVTGSGASYITMAYLPDGSLADRVDRDGPLPWAEAVRIGIKLAGAVETAHRAGTLHRDVKPENVLVSPYGEPQLADFGIASVEGRFETGTGQVTASLVHASPEVLDGAPASASSDVYSLASTVFTLLAGRPAFSRKPDEELVALCLRIARDPVPDLRSRGVPDAACRVVERGMAKDPAGRQPTAAEFGRELQEAQRRAGLPVTDMALALPEPAVRAQGATPRRSPLPTGEDTGDNTGDDVVTDGPPPAVPPPRRRRAAFVVGALVAVAVALVAVIPLGRHGGSRRAVSSSGSTAAPTTSPPSGPTGTLDLPGVRIGSDGAAVAVDPRTNRVYAASSASLTVSVVDGDSKQVRATVPMPSRPQSIAVNQRTGRVYVGTAEATVVVIDGDSASVVASVPIGSRPSGLAINHRTDRVYVATSERALAVIDGPTNRVVGTVALEDRPWGVAVVPETDRVYVTSQEGGSLSVVDGTAQRVVARLAIGSRPCGVATNPRAKRVYVTSQDGGTVAIVDADANTVVSSVRVGSSGCGVAVNSQTERVYVADEAAGTIAVLDGTTNQLLRTRTVFAATAGGDALPYDVDVNPQTDGLFAVSRGSERMLTLTGASL